MMREIIETVDKAMRDAYELVQLVYDNPKVQINPKKSIEEVYLDFFVKLSILYLKKRGFTIHEVKTVYSDENEYTVITLNDYEVWIRNTLSCGGPVEFFEFIVEPKSSNQ